ncbi:MAG: hypothetical protein KatS3mg107_0869 [Gemmataceae bacterium]|nr:MAG: hypothetical protein KatS3mg107_0869 [Gemmataceae bacterium]
MRTPHCTRTPWSFTPPPDLVRDREAHRALHQLRLQLARSAFLGRSFRPRRRYASPGLLLWCRRLLGWQEASLLHRWVLPLGGTLLWYLKSMLTQPGPRRKTEQTTTPKPKRSDSVTAKSHSSASPGSARPVLPLTLESIPAPPSPPSAPSRPAPVSSIEAKPDFFCQYSRRTNRSTGDAKTLSRSRTQSVALIVEAKPIPIVARRAVPRGAAPSSAGRTRQPGGGLKTQAELAERPGRCPPKFIPSTPAVPVTARRQRRQEAVPDEVSPVRSRRPVEPSSARSPRSTVGSSRISPGLSREHDEQRKRQKTEESRHSPLSAGKKLQIRLQELICQTMSGNRRSQKELIQSIVSWDQGAKPQRRSGRRAETKRESWESLAELPRRRKLTKPVPPAERSAPSRPSHLTELSQGDGQTVPPVAVQEQVTSPRAISVPCTPAIHRPHEKPRNGSPPPVKYPDHRLQRGGRSHFERCPHSHRLTVAASTGWFEMTASCHNRGDVSLIIIPVDDRLMIAKRISWMHGAGKTPQARPPPQGRRDVEEIAWTIFLALGAQDIETRTIGSRVPCMPTICHLMAIGWKHRGLSRKRSSLLAILGGQFLRLEPWISYRRKETTKLRSAKISNSRL